MLARLVREAEAEEVEADRGAGSVSRSNARRQSYELDGYPCSSRSGGPAPGWLTHEDVAAAELDQRAGPPPRHRPCDVERPCSQPHACVRGWIGRISGGRGAWLKSKSRRRSPRPGASFAHVGPRVGPPVGLRVQPLPAEEVVLDELGERVEAQLLVVDVAASRVRADHDSRDAKAVAVQVDHRRSDVVVEAAPVIPREEDRRAVPVRAAPDRVDQARDVGLAGLDR